jgi:HSP20 family molecular chaperone IbpA
MTGLRDALQELPEAIFADFLESEDGYLVVLDLPGATEETVDLRVEMGRLIVEARRQKDTPREFNYIREERPLFLDAELPLPPDATGASATGVIDRGVLTIELPKQSATPDQSIPISSPEDD